MKFLKNTLAMVAIFTIGSVNAMNEDWDRPVSPRQPKPILQPTTATEKEITTFIDNEINAVKPVLANFIKKNNLGDFLIKLNPIIRTVAIKFNGDEKAKNLLFNTINSMFAGIDERNKKIWERDTFGNISRAFDNIQYYL